MSSPSQFKPYDEVLVVSKNKHGIVVDYAYCTHWDMHMYSIDCEDEKIICPEIDLRFVA